MKDATGDSTEEIWKVKWGFMGLKIKDVKLLDYQQHNAENIIQFLIKNKNILNIEQFRFGTLVDVQAIRNDGLIQILNPLYITIEIPETKAVFYGWYEKTHGQNENKQKFYVVYDGLIYIMFWKGNNSFDGHEVREILSESIKQSGIFDPYSIPPTPFREDITVKVLSGDSNKIRFEQSESQLLAFVPKPFSKKFLFNSIYLDFRTNFYSYSFVLELTHNLDKIVSSIYDEFSRLSEECINFQDVKYYQFFKKRNKIKKMRGNMANQIQNISNYNKIYNKFILEKNSSIKEINNTKCFKMHIQRFLDELEYNREDFNNIYTLNNYSMDILKSFESSYIYIQGVILGGFLACIAAIIAAFLT